MFLNSSRTKFGTFVFINAVRNNSEILIFLRTNLYNRMDYQCEEIIYVCNVNATINKMSINIIYPYEINPKNVHCQCLTGQTIVESMAFKSLQTCFRWAVVSTCHKG